MHLPHRTHLSIFLSTYTNKRKSAHSGPMAAMCVSSQRLCQMVHSAGLRHGTVDRLHTLLATGWWMAAIDSSYDSQLDQMIVRSTNRFTVVKKLANDIAVLPQPAHPGSSLPATLIGLHGQNLFEALVALRLLADATKNVHLEVALAARRLAMQETVDLHIHVYERIVYIGIYKANENATTLAFFRRLEALDALVEKHLDLATQVAAP
ncbi:unnamed protein product [Triticum aestivum]|uniref:Uncharacterized protein n=1 Tax=Triticum aestivum TaxID=4565 RepID=A0A7H4LF82_WHEAT|nr:unnamed protein product [Triticum aestivum]